MNTHEEICNDQPCRVLDFYPSRQHDIPQLADWFDVTIFFFMKDIAESIELSAPRGFELIADDADDDNRCLLIEHNLPNLKSCKVRDQQEDEFDRQVAVFSFKTALEPQRGDHTMRYFVRMWVRNPVTCEGEEVDGICKVGYVDKEWKMCSKSNVPETLLQCVSGGYDYYTPEVAVEIRLRQRYEAHTSMSGSQSYESRSENGSLYDASLNPGVSLTRAIEPGGGLVKMSWVPLQFAQHRD